MTIDWRPAATRDIVTLRAYLEVHSPGTVETVSNRILGAVESLVQFPRRGRHGRLGGTRELVVHRTPYIVIYRIDEEVVQILRVVHGAQAWPP